MEGLKKDTRKIKYFLMKTLRTTRATTCRTFSIISPGIKLCAQQSFRTSDFRENVINRVAKLSKHHTFFIGQARVRAVAAEQGRGRHRAAGAEVG